MACGILAIDQDIIQISNARNVEQVPQGFIDVSLKRCWSVREPERHHRVLIVPIPRAESNLPNILLRDWDVIIGVSQIKFGKDCCPTESTKRLADQGKRMAVLHSHLIERTVVDRQTQATILLRDK